MKPIIVLYRRRVGLSERVKDWNVRPIHQLHELVSYLRETPPEIEIVLAEVVYKTEDTQL